ncbi:hypothetical protein CMI37_07385 [Candidatus Pacearchaeota archaeon]|nr:hypothetical protein [Candidatus Pacearchaeota archaeon]
MALILPPNFSRDIQNRDTNLVPVVVIGSLRGVTTWDKIITVSTNTVSIEAFNFKSTGTPWMEHTIEAKPLLLNVPSLKESIDIEKRSYKISNANIDISNYKYDGARFSELIGDASLINTECRIFWVSPSTSLIYPIDRYDDVQDNWAMQAYFGTIRKYTHDDEEVKLVVEDKTQATLHRDLPLSQKYLTEENGFANVPKRYKNKPIPMVYGHVDRSPCVISSFNKNTTDDDWNTEGTSFNLEIDSAPLSGIVQDKPAPNAPDNTGFLYLYLANNYYRITHGIGYFTVAYGYSVPQIEPADISLPTVRMNARRAGEEGEGGGALNPLGDNFLEVEFMRYPQAATPWLIDQTLEESEFMTDSNGNTVEQTATFQNQYPIDRFDYGVFEGQDLSHMHDNNPDTMAMSAFYGCKGATDSSLDTLPRGIGFKYSLDHLGIDSDVEAHIAWLQLKYKLETKYYTDRGVNDGEISLFVRSKSGAANTTAVREIAKFRHSKTGDYLAWKEYDNLFGLSGTEHNSIISNNTTTSPPTHWYDQQLPGWDESVDGRGHINIYQMQSAVFEIPVDNYMAWGVSGVGLYQRFLIKDASDRNFYADVIGRANEAGNVMIHVPDIIHHLLRTELGLENLINQNSDEYQALSPHYFGGDDDQGYAFTVDKKINSKKLIEGIASASPFIPRFDNMGVFKFSVIEEAYNSIAQHHISNDDVIDFTFSRTPIEQVYTKIEFYYNWDYAEGEFRSIAEASVLGYEGYEFAYYGLAEAVPVDGKMIHPESTLVIDDDRGKYIRNDTTAADFAQWMLMWSINQHLKIKIKLPLKYMNLEIGDTLYFNELLGGVAPYGIEYNKEGRKVNGQPVFRTFMIVSTNKTLEYCEIECMQMHALSADYDPSAYYDCEGTQYGDAVLDECGVCNGDNSLCLDCEGTPNGGALPDCAGDCNGGALIDSCGVCGGSGATIECLDGSTVCNAVDCADEESTDCAGTVNGTAIVDCAGVCGGNAVLDDCGVCGGDGALAGYDCNGNCIAEVDCAGECGGEANFGGYCGDCWGGITELADGESCLEWDCCDVATGEFQANTYCIELCNGTCLSPGQEIGNEIYNTGVPACANSAYETQEECEAHFSVWVGLGMDCAGNCATLPDGEPNPDWLVNKWKSKVMSFLNIPYGSGWGGLNQSGGNINVDYQLDKFGRDPCGVCDGNLSGAELIDNPIFWDGVEGCPPPELDNNGAVQIPNTLHDFDAGMGWCYLTCDPVYGCAFPDEELYNESATNQEPGACIDPNAGCMIEPTEEAYTINYDPAASSSGWCDYIGRHVGHFLSIEAIWWHGEHHGDSIDSDTFINPIGWGTMAVPTFPDPLMQIPINLSSSEEFHFTFKSIIRRANQIENGSYEENSDAPKIISAKAYFSSPDNSLTLIGEDTNGIVTVDGSIYVQWHGTTDAHPGEFLDWVSFGYAVENPDGKLDFIDTSNMVAGEPTGSGQLNMIIELTTDSNTYPINKRLDDDPLGNGSILAEFNIQFLAEDCPYMRGDMNNDGTVNVLDLPILFECILGLNCPELPYGCAGDMNGDGGYNSLDYVTLVNCHLAQNCNGE